MAGDSVYDNCQHVVLVAETMRRGIVRDTRICTYRERFVRRVGTETNFAKLGVVRLEICTMDRDVALRQKQAQQQRESRDAVECSSLVVEVRDHRG